MITPLKKTPLKNKLEETLVAWAKEEGVDLSKLTIKLNILETPRKKWVEKIEWSDSPVSDDEIREILEEKITPQPRLLLEAMLRTGSREITQETVEQLVETHNLTLKHRWIDGEHTLNTHTKAGSLNALLIKLKLKYRVSMSDGWHTGIYHLKKVCIIKKPVNTPTSKIKLAISAGVTAEGSRYPKD